MERMTATAGSGRTDRHAAAQAYVDLLRQGLQRSDEDALQAAYQYGRDLLAQGFGPLDFAAFHRSALAELMASRPSIDPGHLISLAGRLLVEGLVPFEMRHRGLPEANAARRASEARYRELVENASDVIFTLGIDGRFLSLNRAGRLLSGYSESESLGATIDDVVAPEYVRAARLLRRRRFAGGRGRYTVEIVTKGGERVPLDVSTRLVYEAGHPVAVQGIARDMTARVQAESALRRLNQSLEETARRIAHALHDEAGQLLASVYLKIADLERTPGQPQLAELRHLVDQVEREIRRLSHELRPAILDSLGLIPALELLAEGVSRRSGLPIVVRGSTGGRLSAEVETVTYRVVQEAVTNAVKHARASLITVQCVRDTDGLRGLVVDNGCGFETGAATRGRGAHGLGLIGMRERVAALGGRLTINSQTGHGTSIVFQVPTESVTDVLVRTARR
jgi:PAS domain S-box-containing protein